MALTRAVTDFKDSVKAATTADVTLSGGAPTVVDGVTLLVNDSVLVKSQATPSQNGVYRVTTLGTGANGTWTRRSDFNASNQITGGALTFVEQGTVSGNVYYYLAGGLGTVTVDSTSITFSNLYSTITAGISGGSGTYSNSNVDAYLPTYTGNIKAGNLITVSGIFWSGNGAAYSTGGGSGTPSGANTMVQFNDAGSFGGATYIQYNKTSGNLTSNSTTISANISTGAVVLAGNAGLGVGGNVYVGNRVGYVYANANSAVYTYFNTATNSLDTVFG